MAFLFDRAWIHILWMFYDREKFLLYFQFWVMYRFLNGFDFYT
jgi:hypothetical protein